MVRPGCRLLCGILFVLLAFQYPLAFGEVVKISVSLPGPSNLTYLPVDLIPKIGADTAEEVSLTLIHSSGGGVTLRELTAFNTDFAVTGLPAQISSRVNGGQIITLMAVNDLPLFVLLVRSDLSEQVKGVGDLKGRVIGVTTSSLTSKTTSQQLSELLLRTHGVAGDEARFLPIGQDWESRLAMIQSKRVDAVMAEEPFASRLLETGVVFKLINTAEPDDIAHIPGGGFLFATLATRPDVVSNHPDKVRRMIAMLRRSLAWIATHTPEEIDKLIVEKDGPMSRSLLSSLQRYPRLFSKDGRFSTQQLRETELFYRSNIAESSAHANFNIESMIDDRWVGRSD